MIKFKKLKLKGFKSFVEPTEIRIENGLTGIVGPNGCGKSNLVEAFRFVMGELSPKQMRGSELDDVIFNGTSGRPSWDIAEVTIDLDNSDRKAPSLFNQNDEIEVTRRIWRGEGSEYRVNGKEVRLKDVQLLFADAATGARSTSMVSQGRIGAIIVAKPEQRRALLEEAAGISGIHARRHESELRLNSAENNLKRADALRRQQEKHLENLRIKDVRNKLVFFKQHMMYYKFNLKYENFTWIGSRACKKKNLISPQWLRNIKNKNYPWWRLDTYFSNLKHTNIKFVEEGGWHFSYIKTPEDIEKKLKSYAHHREYDLNSLGIQKIKNKIQNKESIYDLKTDMKKSKFDSGQKLTVSAINELPIYIQNNLDKYKQWLEQR